MADSQVTKLDVVQRQLNAAIRMYLIEEDQLAIHTLVMATLQVLRDLAKTNSDSTLHDILKAAIKPGKEKLFWSTLKQPSNFLKHAERDHSDTINEVSEEANGHLILMNCAMLGQMRVATVETSLFIALQLTRYPELPLIDEEQPWVPSVKEMRKQFRGVSREELFSTARTALEIIKSQGSVNNGEE